MKMEKAYLVIVLLFGAVAVGLGNEFDFDEKDLETESSLWSLYERWISHHSLFRTDEEMNQRFDIFKSNALDVWSFNKKDEAYELGLNEFSDMTAKEFRSLHACVDVQEQQEPANGTAFMYKGVHRLPRSIDWRKKGAVTRVKKQFGCGSCWAFSTVGSVEGINYIRTKKLVSLSAQELVDCEKKRSHVCKWGFLKKSLNFIEKNGITTERNYPYNAKDGKCDWRKVKSPAVKIDGYENVTKNNEDALMRAVAHQPVSAGIDSRSHHFDKYRKGVFTGECGTKKNHYVTIVGYGNTDDGVKYWLIKNSWGTGWGEDGYMRLLRGIEEKEGLCGIAQEAAYPIKKSSKDAEAPNDHDEL